MICRNGGLRDKNPLAGIASDSFLYWSVTCQLVKAGRKFELLLLISVTLQHGIV